MKRLNWQIWAGFLLSLFAGLSYGFLFVRWPITREFPWANLILFAIAFVLLFFGLRRAFKPDRTIVSKIFSSLAAAFGVRHGLVAAPISWSATGRPEGARLYPH